MVDSSSRLRNRESGTVASKTEATVQCGKGGGRGGQEGRYRFICIRPVSEGVFQGMFLCKYIRS